MINTIKIIISIILICSYSNANAAKKQAPQSQEQVLLSFAPLVKKASPAVVNIYTKKKIKVKRSASPFFNDPLFNHFFADRFKSGKTQERISSSLGSGVIVSSDGKIITNHHVVSDSTDITVVLSDRREFSAKKIVDDKRTDLTLLQIDTKGDELPFINLMDSDNLEVGDIVMAIGNPFGVGQTVTNGIVSAVARTTVGVSDYHFFIQTDAAINPGNSGGALINMNGDLAGINSAIFSKGGGSNGIGFAIPANMVATVIRSQQGNVIRPWLGVTMQGVTQELANSLGMKIPSGAIVSSLNKNGPAAKAGIKVGDVVIGINQHEIMDEHSLKFRTATYEVGKKAIFKILRKGDIKNIKVTMVAPPENPKRDLRLIAGKNALSGATIGNLSPALAEELGINMSLSGVTIIRMNRGIASSIGINTKDIIKSINGSIVTSAKQAQKVLNKGSDNGWTIAVKRGERLLKIIWNGR